MLRHRIPLVILGVLVFVVYIASSNGIVSSNDGSHMALVRAMAEDGTFSIDRHLDLAGRLDFAEHAGRAYSDRPPGTAWLTLSYYVIVKWIGERLFTDPLHFALVAIPLVPALTGTANVLLVGGIARLGGASTGWALLAAGLYGLGTVQWRYGTALFSHSFSALFLLAAMYMVLRSAVREGSLGLRGKVLLGALLGYSLTLDYLNIVGAAGIAVLAWRQGLAGGEGSVLRRYGPFAAAVLVPVVLLLAYQWISFGSPFSTSYSKHARFLWSRSFETTFTNNPLSGLANYLLVVVRNSNPGDLGGDGGVLYPLLQTTPLLLVGFYGLVVLRRYRPTDAVFLSGIILAGMTLMAAHKTYWGGGTGDTRYILPWLALLAPGVAWGLQDLGSRLGRNTQLAGAVAVGLLVVFTMVQHLRMQAGFLDHDDEGVPFVPGTFVQDIVRIDRVLDHAIGLPEHVRGLAGKLK